MTEFLRTRISKAYDLQSTAIAQEVGRFTSRFLFHDPEFFFLLLFLAQRAISRLLIPRTFPHYFQAITRHTLSCKVCIMTFETYDEKAKHSKEKHRVLMKECRWCKIPFPDTLVAFSPKSSRSLMLKSSTETTDWRNAFSIVQRVPLISGYDYHFLQARPLLQQI